MFPNLVNQNFPERYYIFFNFFVMPVISENLGRITQQNLRHWNSQLAFLYFLSFLSVSGLTTSLFCAAYFCFSSAAVCGPFQMRGGEIYTKADKGYPYLVRAKQNITPFGLHDHLVKSEIPWPAANATPHSLSTYNLLHLDTVTW